MSISIIIPTIARRSLWRALESVAPQLDASDEVLVVGDGPQPTAHWMIQHFQERHPGQFRYLHTLRPAYDFGNTPRDLGIAQANGQWLAFLDDDDEYTPNALQAMRAAIASVDYPAMHLFRCEMWGYERIANGTLVWVEPGPIEDGNVATPNVVVPNRRPLPYWAGDDDHYIGDLRFIKACAELYEVIWHDEKTTIAGKPI